MTTAVRRDYERTRSNLDLPQFAGYRSPVVAVQLAITGCRQSGIAVTSESWGWWFLRYKKAKSSEAIVASHAISREAALVAELPTGTVTFLFTDIEGSTRLWAADPTAMSLSLRVHDEIVRSEIMRRDGFVFGTAGDSFAVAFSRSSAAIEAAEAIQAELRRVQWSSGPQLRVRMGVHLGEPEERDGDYWGPVLNTTARIEAAGHGGQVLFSDAVRLAASLTGGITDLGVQRLRDVPEAIQVYQLGEETFPPIRTVEMVQSTLPTARSRLIGREDDVREIRSLLAGSRLVTLAAVGGAGKTRLALEVASRELDDGAKAAFFVDLATLNDDAQVGSAFATAMEFIPSSTEPVAEQVRRRIGSDPILLLVDNCEHLIDEVAGQVDELLSVCREVRVLATSREPLDIEGETVVRVSPLSIDGDDGGLGSATRLFVERARIARPDVTFGEDELATIRQLCVRLDGLPLAIELAAARTQALSPSQIMERLEDRFSLLTARRRRTAARQQTLEAAIGWSFDLLAADEQQVLECVSVFPATFDLEAVQAVTEMSPRAALDLVESLLAKSLVQHAGTPGIDSARYRLLETVRAFAQQHLAAKPGQGDIVRSLYARHVADELEAYAPWVFAPLSPELAALADDLLPAIEIARSAEDYELLGRLAASALPLWSARGKLAEADGWLTLAESHVSSRTRSRCLSTHWSIPVWLSGQEARSTKLAREGLEAHDVRDQPWAWYSLLGLGIGRFVNHPTEAAEVLDQARQACGWANHRAGAERAIDWLEAVMALWNGDFGHSVQKYDVSHQLDANDLLLAPFRLQGTLYANYLSGDHVANASLMRDPEVEACRSHWFDYARRGAQNVLGVEIAAAIAHAGIGHIDEASDLLRRAYVELGASPWPRLPADFLLGLAAVNISAGDTTAAKKLLNGFSLGRYPESQALGYHLIARLNDLGPEDWPRSASNELLRRVKKMSQADWDTKAHQLVQEHLNML